MTRFIRPAYSKVLLATNVAVLAAPSRPEISTATDLTPSLKGIRGFAVDAGTDTMPAVNDTFAVEVAGLAKATEQNALSWWDDHNGSALRPSLVEGSSRVVILVPYSDVGGRRCEVWPVRIVLVADEQWGEEPASFRAIFAATAAPVRNAVLPAA